MEHEGTVGICPNHIFGSYINPIYLWLGAGDAHHTDMYQPYSNLFRQAWLFKIENNRWLDCETGQQQKFRCKKHISIIIKTAVREILLFFYHRVKIRGGDFKQWNASTMYQHCAQWGQSLFKYFKGQLKFIYSEKATKYCEIFTLLLTTVHTVKSKVKVKISQHFVAFSDYMNFNFEMYVLVPSILSKNERKQFDLSKVDFFSFVFGRIWCLQFSQKTNENNSTWVKSTFFHSFFGRIEDTKKTFRS